MSLSKLLLSAAILVGASTLAASAQTAPDLANVVGTCGTPGSTYTAGQNRPVTQNTSGLVCTGASFTPSGTQDTNLKQVNGATVNVGPGASSTGTQRVTTSSDSTIGPASRTLVTLAVKTVTTGGTAVSAIAAGQRSAGGFLQNPIGATIALCINEIGTATGTTSSGDTTCIQPGQSYNVSPAAGAVSVITSDSSHPFSGYGLQ